MTSRRETAAALCWAFQGEPSAHRFVTHLRLLGIGPVRLPAPMPETWVAALLGAAVCAAVVAFVVVTAAGLGAVLAALVAAGAAWFAGVCFRPPAAVRLRAEALGVLRTLRDDAAGRGE